MQAFCVRDIHIQENFYLSLPASTQKIIFFIVLYHKSSKIESYHYIFWKSYILIRVLCTYVLSNGYRIIFCKVCCSKVQNHVLVSSKLTNEQVESTISKTQSKQTIFTTFKTTTRNQLATTTEMPIFNEEFPAMNPESEIQPQTTNKENGGTDSLQEENTSTPATACFSANATLITRKGRTRMVDVKSSDEVRPFDL